MKRLKVSEGISDAALAILEEANIFQCDDGPFDIEWVRVKPPTSDAPVICSPTTGRTHLAGISEKPKIKKIMSSPTQDAVNSWKVDVLFERPRKVYTLSDIDQELLQSIRSTSEVAIGLLISIMRFQASREHNRPGERIQGKTFACTHLGRVGSHIVEAMQAMGSRWCQDEIWDCCPDILFVTSRYEGQPLITQNYLSILKDGVYIVNVARSELVDRDAITAAMRSGKVAGYAEDVTDDRGVGWIEYHSRNWNIVGTKHLGGFARESLEEVETALAKVVVDDLV